MYDFFNYQHFIGVMINVRSNNRDLYQSLLSPKKTSNSKFKLLLHQQYIYGKVIYS